MSWTPRTSSYLACNLLLPDNKDVVDLFDNYKDVVLELNANPLAIAVRESKRFTAYASHNSKIRNWSKLSHDDNITEVGWLPDGEICYIAREEDLDVNTGVITELMEYGNTYEILGPYKAQHELIWNTFLGLCNNKDVVLRLVVGDEPSRLTCSPLLPLVYAGLDALGGIYNPKQLHPTDILAFGWSRLLLLVADASKVDLAKLLLHISPKMCELLVNTIVAKREEESMVNALENYGDSDPYGWNQLGPGIT